MQPGFFMPVASNRKEETMLLLAGILGFRLLQVIFEWQQMKNEKTIKENERVIHPAEFPMR